ncbi:hypothetical protein CEXT_464871 [Caerostris extrusa]|uniref:Uncharacterized protein n=1 Tax=Caerostris extrusa TaxID=172846 RepID=A0AAV4Y749_CAEEX|nr:hypothetical protein CEXT_464871 [Caerostris extrusa]
MRSSRRSTKNHTASAGASREEGIAWLDVGEKENLTSFQSRLPPTARSWCSLQRNKATRISMWGAYVHNASRTGARVDGVRGLAGVRRRGHAQEVGGAGRIRLLLVRRLRRLVQHLERRPVEAHAVDFRLGGLQRAS